MKKRELEQHLREHGCQFLRGRFGSFDLGESSDGTQGSYSAAQRNQTTPRSKNLPLPFSGSPQGSLNQARIWRTHLQAGDRSRGEFFHTNETGRGGTTSSSAYNV
jgi:hypothetical protein